MWGVMSARQYPNNTIGGNVTYGELWDYLNCLSISPCRGWLNNNATIRNLTVEWAHQLDQVYQNLVLSQKNYTRFDLTYIENPDLLNTKWWVSQNGSASDLFEWIGGGLSFIFYLFFSNNLFKRTSKSIATRIDSQLYLESI